MNKRDFNKVVQKWEGVIKNLIEENKRKLIDKNKKIDQTKLTKIEKLCLYADYYEKIESLNNSNTLFNTPNNETKLSLLPLSLNILICLNDLDNIYFIDAPRVDVNNKSYTVGDLEFSFDVNPDSKIEELEEELITDKLKEHFETLKKDKEVYIYSVVDNIKLLSEKTLVPKVIVRSRYFTI